MIDLSPLTIASDMPLTRLIALMQSGWQEKAVRSVLVMHGNKPLGILTAWHLVQLCVSGIPMHDRVVGDVALPPLITVKEDDLHDPFTALSILQHHRMDQLPIVDRCGNLVGLVTPNSIQRALQPANLLKAKRVSDLTLPPMVHACLQDSALRIAQLMSEYQFDCITIVESSTEQSLIPVGLVTTHDLLSLEQRGLALAQVNVQTIMHTPLVCLTVSDSLWLAHEEMRQQPIDYLVVCDQQGQLLGALTPLELLQAIDVTEMHKAVRHLRQTLRQPETEKVDRLRNQNAELEHLVRSRTAQLEEQAKCDRLLAATTLRIHRSLNLQEILSTTVADVQQLLQTDRAIIYRLDADGSGVVVVEALQKGCIPMAGHTIDDRHFASSEWLDAYKNGHIQAVEDIYTAGLSQCHIDLLAQFQIRANLVLPIICGQKLWGLLATQHCAHPWRWQDWEIHLLDQLVQQVGIALQQSELYEQAQTELKERQRAEEELSRLFNLSPDMVCVASTDGYFKQVNPAFTNILGYSDSELLANPFIYLVHPDDQAATLATLEHLVQGRAVDYFENRYRCKDESYRWLAWTAAPDNPAKGLFYAIARDITTQKQAESLLKQSKDELEAKVEARTASWRQANEQLLVEIAERNRIEVDLRKAKDQLQAVLDAVPGLVSWISADLRYLGLNSHVAATFNKTIDSFIGQPINFLDGSAQFTQFFQQFFVKPLQTDAQEIVVEVNGISRDYLIVAQKYDQNQAAVSVGIDISDRKQMEGALQESEAKFRNLVEQTNDWVWEMDCSLCFTYLNPRVQEITGYAPEEILTKRIFDFMPADAAVRFTTVLNYSMQQHDSFSQLETTMLHKDGHPVVLEMSGTPVFTTHGELQGYRGITRDITDRKQVERDIRKALTKEKELNELKTRFISMASHEFRTPLTTILASAESLERYQFKWTDDKKRSTLQRIQTAVKHMTDLLNDVLIFGKGEAGKLEFKPTLLDLGQFCADLVEEFQFKENNPQRLCFALPDNPTQSWADEKLLRHILVNLLANALKYSPPETSVQLTLHCQDGTAMLQIQDAGIGIPLSEQKRLFDSFYRATNVGNIPGTGLGLAIVKRAVEAHGGTIAVASESGSGTTFTVSLPITGVKSEA